MNALLVKLDGENFYPEFAMSELPVVMYVHDDKQPKSLRQLAIVEEVAELMKGQVKFAVLQASDRHHLKLERAQAPYFVVHFRRVYVSAGEWAVPVMGPTEEFGGTFDAAELMTEVQDTIERMERRRDRT